MTEENDNKRIAKNTVLLYGRSLVSMAVGLYTSRIILEALGISDYGLYGAVGSIVALFSILNGVLSAGTSRFLTFELGRGDKERLSKIFSAAFIMHAVMAVVLFILMETFGLWFLNNKMNIPLGREFAANIVYQLSILTCMLSLTQVPYGAIIIAREEMSIYAYVGLLESFFKLASVAMLLYVSFSDNLIAYAIICAIWSVGLQLFYRWYCVKHFEESRLHIERDKTIYKEMLSYSIWDLIGQFCSTGNTQGANILLNMFFGVVLNAANAVATTVLNALTALNNNFLMSVQPQIVKSYAKGDIKRFFELIYNSGKFSFFFVYIIALPVALEAPYILLLWLKDVPQYTTLFVWVTIGYVLIRAFANPVVRGVHATGDIKFLNFSSGLFSMSITLPVLYVFYKYGAPFWILFIIIIVRAVGCNMLETISLHRNITFGYWDYFKRVYLHAFFVALVPAIPSTILTVLLPSSLGRLLLVVVVSFTLTLISIYYIGLDKETQVKVVCFVKRKLNFK